MVIAPAGVNVRTGPGSAYPIIGTANFGVEGAIIGRSADGLWWVTPVRGAPNGQGYVNVLNAAKLIQSPHIYAMFLLWMLSELFDTLPEEGKGGRIGEKHEEMVLHTLLATCDVFCSALSPRMFDRALDVLVEPAVARPPDEARDDGIGVVLHECREETLGRRLRAALHGDDPDEDAARGEQRAENDEPHDERSTRA